MKGTLKSDYEFETQGTLLKFKYRLLNSCLLVAVVFALLVGGLYDLGVHDTGYIHSRVNYTYAILSAALFIWFRYSKESYTYVAVSLVFISLITFTSALVFVEQDQFRIIWFYIIVFFAYTVIGNRAGIITTVVSLVIIITCSLLFDLGLSQTTLQGALLGLVISSVLVNVHTRRVSAFEAVLMNKQNELEVLATIDGLTGVMNRRMFNEMMAKYLEVAKRSGQSLSFLYLDLDYFKKINDAHGHQVGDIMLIKFTAAVDECLRKSDLMGRIGGEEFAVVLFETAIEDAVAVAEKIRCQVYENTYQYGSKSVEMTTSIGVSQLESDEDTMESIQSRADVALYKAKEMGRNRVEMN